MSDAPIALASYEEFGKDYAEALKNNAYNAHFERPSTLALMPDVRGKKVLDAGCGPGAYIEWLLANGADVTAVDVSPSMVKLAQDANGDKARIFAHDLSQPLDMLADASFDIIIASLMIHYIEDISALFNEFYRLLKTGGQVLISTHHPVIDMKSSISGNYFEQELLEQTWNTVGRPVNVRFYRRSLSATLDAMTFAGFVIEKFSEGVLTQDLKNLYPETHAKLSIKPQFIFLRLRK